jgi:uncharacterized iron-regulated membrane protein
MDTGTVLGIVVGVLVGVVVLLGLAGWIYVGVETIPVNLRLPVSDPPSVALTAPQETTTKHRRSIR